MLTRRGLVFALMGVLSIGAALPASSPNSFEGRWAMDKKGSPSGNTAPGNLVQQIKVDGNNVTILSKYDQPKNGIYPLFWVGIMVEKLDLVTNGSDVTNHIGPFLHVSKTTQEGPKMVTDWTANIDPGKVDGQWIRTLSADGREMTLEIHGKASDGRTMDSTVIFHRK